MIKKKVKFYLIQQEYKALLWIIQNLIQTHYMNCTKIFIFKIFLQILKIKRKSKKSKCQNKNQMTKFRYKVMKEMMKQKIYKKKNNHCLQEFNSRKKLKVRNLYLRNAKIVKILLLNRMMMKRKKKKKEKAIKIIPVNNNNLIKKIH